MEWSQVWFTLSSIILEARNIISWLFAPLVFGIAPIYLLTMYGLTTYIAIAITKWLIN